MKSIFLTILLKFCICYLFAQAPNLQWAKNVGGESPNYFSGYPANKTKNIKTDKFGNIYRIGYFQGTIDLDPSASVFSFTALPSVMSSFICKLDSSGNFIWAKLLKNTMATCINLDKNGNIFVGGKFFTSNDFDPSNSIFNIQGYGGFVSKYNNNGDLNWAKPFLPTNQNAIYAYDQNGVGVNDIIVDNNENVISVGEFIGTVDFNPGTPINNFTAGQYLTDLITLAFVNKLNSNGVFVWNKVFYGAAANSKSTNRAVVLDIMNNIYFTGSFGSVVDFDPAPNTSYLLTSLYNANFLNSSATDIFICKLSENGIFNWAKKFGGIYPNEDEHPINIALDNLGNVYTSGDCAADADYDPGPNVANLPFSVYDRVSMYINKLDNNGNFIWVKGYLRGPMNLYGMEVDGSGNLYFTGSFSNTQDFDPNDGIYNLNCVSWCYYNAFVYKLNSSGNFEWAFSLGNSAFASGYHVALDSSSNIYIVGQYDQYSDFDPSVQVFNLPIINNGFGGNIFMQKLSLCSISIPNFTSLPSSYCIGNSPPSLPLVSNNGIIGTWSPSTVSNTTTGTYTFTPNAGQCANSITKTIVVNTSAAATFNPIPPFCSGSTAPILPSTSTNGVSGTWSPTTVSNTNSGTYIFTPNAGQCSNTIATLNVTVNIPTLPTFNLPTVMCIGPTPPTLPLISTNNITGTWSPATINNTTAGTYTFTPNGGQCAINTSINILVDTLVIPTFSNITSICSGTTAPLLLTTSNNGITGTWSPSTVSSTTTGTYTFTPNAGQCANSITKTIVVNTSAAATFNPIPPFCSGSTAPILLSISTNGVSGTWSPSTVSNTNSGSYNFTPNAGQCSNTIATLNVTVNIPTIPTFNLPTVICSGTTPPTLPLISTNNITGTWSPSTVNNTTAGTYIFTPNAGQCAINTSINILVDTLVIPTFSNITSICSGTTAPLLLTTSNNGITGTWNPSIINNTTSGTYTFTPAVGQCAQAITKNISVVNLITPTFISIAPFCKGTPAPLLPATSTNNIVGTWNPAIIDNLISGTYTFTANANALQCYNTKTINVTIVAPTVPNFALPSVICYGNVAPLLLNNSNNGVLGSWSPSIVSNTSTSTYLFTPNVGVCATNYNATIIVNSLIVPMFDTILPLCNGSVSPLLPLIATNAITGIWTPAIISNTTSGTYTFTPTLGQCATTVTKNVVVNNKVNSMFNSITPFCSGTLAPNLSTTSNNGITGNWTPSIISNTTSGIYTFTPNSNQCALPTTISVVVKPNPIAHIGADTTICNGITTLLNVSNSDPATTYLWHDGSTLPTFLIDRAGVYTVAVALNGCQKTSTKTVTYIQKPNFSLGVDTTICAGDSILLNPKYQSNIPFSYLWYDGSTAPLNTIRNKGMYFVIISNICGSKKDEINITSGLCKVIAPNAFTPNGDGKNDLFKINKDIRIKTFALTIYNRYGQILFKSNNPNIGWDGKFNGILQPIGTYTYNVKYVEEYTNKANNFNGVVSIIK